MVILRKVKISDAKILFEWANNESIRKFSFSKEEIIWDAHIEWLKKN